MGMRTAVVLVLLIIACSHGNGNGHGHVHGHAHGHYLHTKNDDDVIRPICGQDLVWNYRKQFINTTARGLPPIPCAQSICDDPVERDRTQLTLKEISVRFHVIMGENGEWPTGLTQANLEDGIKKFQEIFEALAVRFKITAIEFHQDSRFFCLPAYGQPNWLSEAEIMKVKYAERPEREFNVFVACMDAGSSGRLNGYGTFPWDPEALTANGGVFMNSIVMSPMYSTLPHEFGHNIGLWHTFHGQAEVSCGSECYEPVHEIGDSSADIQGDYCSDTLSAPRYWDCAPPMDKTCTGGSFLSEDAMWENIMSYSSCRTLFTEQQVKRAHCFLCNELRSIVSGCP